MSHWQPIMGVERHGSWRLLEVVRAMQTLPGRSSCVSDSVLADLRLHVDIIEAEGPLARRKPIIYFS
jgi:hypothetical protein